MASNIRAMPENEKPPARRVDVYLHSDELKSVDERCVCKRSSAKHRRSFETFHASGAKLAGVNVPEDTKILIGEVESVDIAEEFAHEKLSPVLAMYKAKTFDEALDKAAQLVADGGYGHTSSLYVHPAEKEKIQKHYEAMKTCRVLINTPASQGGIGDLYNFKLAPSLTLGCGSWGSLLDFPVL